MIEDKELYAKAKKAAINAYAPYSHFKVGAALLCDSGNIYTGVNIENSSYGATICAERSALNAAVGAGEKKFIKIAVASSQGEAWPCGICRQVLLEFSDKNNPMKIITGTDENSLEIYDIEKLLFKGLDWRKDENGFYWYCGKT